MTELHENTNNIRNYFQKYVCFSICADKHHTKVIPEVHAFTICCTIIHSCDIGFKSFKTILTSFRRHCQTMGSTGCSRAWTSQWQSSSSSLWRRPKGRPSRRSRVSTGGHHLTPPHQKRSLGEDRVPWAASSGVSEEASGAVYERLLLRAHRYILCQKTLYKKDKRVLMNESIML